ncbi:unnamed protein product [Rotaria sordida]|uniref:Uncharacterized protein n=1 Tax=Rotaria sordida TaxID=392033 RepID=A0A815D759_9BILA|nr:unnamed protein product [Rotaria sordida]CAF1568118.1 unnamed protein product [Rotaria sordida]
MLKVEYLNKLMITQTDAKQHLHNIRYRRQNQLAILTNECHQPCILHRRSFDNQLNSSSSSIEKPFISKPLKNESIFICISQTESDYELLILKSESSYIFIENQLPNPIIEYSIEKFPLISTLNRSINQNKLQSKLPSIIYPSSDYFSTRTLPLI